jgi:SAM-dependent methyltransferase
MSDFMEKVGSKPKYYYHHVRKEMLPFFLTQFKRVLDVGCGNGRFGEQLKTSFPGLEVCSVGPVAESQAAATHLLDHALLGHFDTALQLPDNYFYVVVFNDSLEHFPDHVPALELALRLLKPGGAVVASIPNIRYWPQLQKYLIEGDWRYESAGVLDRTHLRFSTRKSVLRELAAAGFEMQSIEGINACWLRWKFRLLRALMPTPISDMPYQQFDLKAVKPMTS